jgi:fatty acid synthase subunit beta
MIFAYNQLTAEDLQAKLDAIKLEHGDAYLDGIAPVFSALKARTFDSSWNWVRQSSIQLFYDIIHGDLDPSTVFADEPSVPTLIVKERVLTKQTIST